MPRLFIELSAEEELTDTEKEAWLYDVSRGIEKYSGNFIRNSWFIDDAEAELMHRALTEAEDD